MILIVRGALWYGLYLFLIVLPLATAVAAQPDRLPQPFLLELGVAFGFIGFSIMGLEFALVSRIKAAAQPFGEDSLQLFHNLMGGAALLFILAHPALLIISGYPANCWLNPFASCANTATRTAVFAVLALLILIGISIWRRKLRLRYEIWYVLHGVLALFVVFTALIHIFIIGRYTTTLTMKLVWLLYTSLILGLMFRYKIWTPVRNWKKRWVVVENRPEKGDCRTLVLKPVDHPGFSFQPGQFAWIKTGKTPFGLGQHPISFSSLGDVDPGGTVSFTIKNLGDWSGQEVPAVKPGNIVWLDGPHGVFTMDREQAMGYVFIGGGIGITPLYSMLQTMAEREDVRPVLLFYGAANSAAMTFQEELAALQGRLNLQVIPVFSQAETGWAGETGFINGDILKKYLPRQYRRFKYLICGPAPLMDAMETALPALGVPPENVLTERFDMV